MAKFEPPENEEERRAWIKRQKAKGVRAFKGRYGWVASTVPLPNEPSNRRPAGPPPEHPRCLPPLAHADLDQQAAWRVLAAKTYFITETAGGCGTIATSCL